MDTFKVPSHLTEDVRLWCSDNAPSNTGVSDTVSMDEADSFFFMLRWFPACALVAWVQ